MAAGPFQLAPSCSILTGPLLLSREGWAGPWSGSAQSSGHRLGPRDPDLAAAPSLGQGLERPCVGPEGSHTTPGNPTVRDREGSVREQPLPKHLARRCGTVLGPCGRPLGTGTRNLLFNCSRHTCLPRRAVCPPRAGACAPVSAQHPGSQTGRVLPRGCLQRAQLTAGQEHTGHTRTRPHKCPMDWPCSAVSPCTALHPPFCRLAACKERQGRRHRVQTALGHDNAEGTRLVHQLFPLWVETPRLRGAGAPMRRIRRSMWI